MLHRTTPAGEHAVLAGFFICGQAAMNYVVGTDKSGSITTA
jgi:hypothetical protein